MFNTQGAAAADDDDLELGAELLLAERELGASELELLERDELLIDELLTDELRMGVTAVLDDDAVTVPHKVPLNVGISAAAAPLLP